MAGVSNLPFRMLNRRFGCELAFVEMVNSNSVSYKSKHTQKMLSSHKDERPLGVQLLGRELDSIQRAIDVLNRYDFDILDFNAACPARKVVRRGAGAALLREPKELSEILKIVVKESKAPVTVKIRSGWDNNSVNAKLIASYCQDAGVAGVFIHGRTRFQKYVGAVDYNTISEVKKALDIPVIGSGDIFNPKLAKKMLDETGCDALLIARGSIGNPWIFKEVEEFLKNGKIIARPTRQEITRAMVEHLNMCIDFYGTRVGLSLFRRYFGRYIRVFCKAKKLRDRAYRVKTKHELDEIIRQFAMADS